MQDYGHWDLLIDDFKSELYFGFVYIILDNVNNKRYIGKKNFDVTGEVIDSWKYYTGSQKHLNAEINKIGKENFDFIIIDLCKTKAELNKKEYTLHILNNVLKAQSTNNEKLFYNRTISNSVFDSSGIKRKDWLHNPKIYPIHTFINVDTNEQFMGSYIELADKLSTQSKRILKITKGNNYIAARWTLVSTDVECIKGRKRIIENTVTGEQFSGTFKEILSYIGTTHYCLKDLLCGKQKTTRGWKLINK